MTTELERDLEALAQTLRASNVAVRSARGAGSGSGVIWSAGGTVVTNAHVARSASVEVELADGRRLPGRVERRDESRDLASIRVAGGELTPARIRDPGELRVGEFVAAFGHPLGVPNVLSTGIVYARHRSGSDRFVQSDVKLEPGNSGGALADAAGRVVGINSMVAGGLALAIPADAVRRFLGEAVPTRRLGVRLAPAQFSAAQFAPAQLGDRGRAYAVLAIEPGSSAERSGLIVGDLILTRNLAALAAAPHLDVVRGGSPLTVRLQLGSEAAAAA